MLKANRYLQALQDRRYIKDSYVMEEATFSKLIEAYKRAGRKKLTQYALLRIQAAPEEVKEKAELIRKHLRQSDYLGQRGGCIYALLSNTGEDGAQIVVKRLSENGLASAIERNPEL